MRGLLFTELLGFATDRFGGDVTDRLASARGAYDPLAPYPGTEFLDLVAALEASTGYGGDGILRAFGEHLFGRLVALYPVLFVGGDSATTFLARVERDVRRLMPDVELPAVEVRHETGGLEVRWASGPPMADLAEGLIRGCVARFAEPLVLERRDESGPAGPAVLFILRRPVVPPVNDVQPV